ncbi:MAG: hypothetical protein V3U78_04585 [Thiotrichaceae bacterium]
MEITLNQIKQHGPTNDMWRSLQVIRGTINSNGEPFPLVDLLESNGLRDTVWAFRCLPEHNKIWIKYLLDCVTLIAHKGPALSLNAYLTNDIAMAGKAEHLQWYVQDAEVEYKGFEETRYYAAKAVYLVIQLVNDPKVLMRMHPVEILRHVLRVDEDLEQELVSKLKELLACFVTGIT